MKTKLTKEEDEELIRELKKLGEKYPEHIMIIVEMDSHVIKLKKNKYATNKDIKMGEFIRLVKDKMEKENKERVGEISSHILNMKMDTYKEIKEVQCNMTVGEMYKENEDEVYPRLIRIKMRRETTYKNIREMTYKIAKRIVGKWE